jgi:acyl-CoA hydrolase
MDLPKFESLFELEARADGDYVLSPHPFMSNARPGTPPESAGPHGGLLAVACLKSACAHLGAAAPPLRSLTIQYLSVPKFSEIILRPKTLRAGRSITFMGIEATQDQKPILNVIASFGASDDSIGHRPDDFPRVAEPESLELSPPNPTIPRHAALIEQAHAGGGTFFGSGKEAMYQLWRRMADGKPLNEDRAVFMIDAMLPPLHATTDSFHRCASADLRYDFISPLTPDLTPDGWALFEFRARDWSGGWTIDEVTVWSRAGRLLALGRQQRKMLDPQT